MTFGLDTLRVKTLAVIAVLVVAPVLFVWFTSPFEDAIGGNMRTDLLLARQQAVDTLLPLEAPESDYLEVARRFDAWIRVIDVATGEEVMSANGTVPSIRERVLFAPQPVPTIEEWDDTQPKISEREEVKEAVRAGDAGGCGYGLGEQVLVCSTAVRVRMLGKPDRVVHVTSSYGRGTTGLHDQRFHILKLMTIVLTMAVALGLWLAGRIARPLTSLREQVIERTKPPVSTRSIEHVGDREFDELTNAFNELLGALDERRRSNEKFMADMAHEIKNPVAAIRAASESLARGEDVPAKRAERLSNILRDSARRLDGVVTNFLELARAESGLPEVKREEVALGKLVENAMSSYAADDRYEHLKLTTDCADVWAAGSAEHLERAVRNLVENALSFAQTRVDVRVKRIGDMVEVRVKDDGKGIPPEDVDRVFDRFFTRRDDGGGTGLGLAMTRAIIDAHAGEIEVESALGTGTTFTFTVPRLDGLSG